jgi:crotonobetainyl-CoA:carnitine CoA-transferase CaiB-like acyl-CoA transferase
MALLDSQVAVLGNQAMNYLVSGNPPPRLGNAHPNIVPYDVFPVADGHIIIATGNDGQWRKLCEVLGDAPLASHADYADNRSRVANRVALTVALLHGLTQRYAKADLLAALEAVGVPAGPINASTRSLPIRRSWRAASRSTCPARRPRPVRSRPSPRRS